MSANTLDTPPSSDVELTSRLPPSPPLSPKKRACLSPVDRLLETLRLYKAGKLHGARDCLTFHLTRDQHAAFQRRLQAEAALWQWYQDKVRHDWEPPTGQDGIQANGRYTLRMPSKLHECFIAEVRNAISVGIRKLADEIAGDGSHADVVKQLRGLYDGGSTLIKMQEPRLENSSQESDDVQDGMEKVVQRSPDASWYSPSQPAFPVLVAEVCYSQQQKGLPKIADGYIIDSQHNVRCVLGFDIPYATANTATANAADRTATMSLWRPGMEQDDDGEVGVCTSVLDAVAFRNADGTPNEGSFALLLSDLFPTITTADLIAAPAAYNLTIPFSDLAAFLARAEGHAATTNERPTSSKSIKRFRKRKRTPEEELSDGREAEYVRQTEAEAEANAKKDGDWRARTRRRTTDVSKPMQVVERRSSRRIASGRAAGIGS